MTYIYNFLDLILPFSWADYKFMKNKMYISPKKGQYKDTTLFLTTKGTDKMKKAKDTFIKRLFIAILIFLSP